MAELTKEEIFRLIKSNKEERYALNSLLYEYFRESSNRVHYPDVALLEIIMEAAIYNSSIKEALECFLLTKPDEWYDSIKHFPVNGMIRKVVDENKHRKGYRRLTSKGNLSTVELRKTPSTAGFYGKLKKSQDLLNELLKLEDRDDMISARVSLLEGILNVRNCCPKERVFHLKNEGFTNKEISELLRVSISTVKRWHKEMQDLDKSNT